MQSLSSILAPAASAARHLAQALSTARSDFTEQANRTRRHVAGDLDHVRDDVGEATTRLSEVLGDTVAAIQEASATYRDEARRIYEKRGGGKHQDASAIRRHPYLTAGMAFSVGYLALRAWHSRRATRAESATKMTGRGKKSMDDASPTKSRGRRARPSKSGARRKEANGIGETDARTATH